MHALSRANIKFGKCGRLKNKQNNKNQNHQRGNILMFLYCVNSSFRKNLILEYQIGYCISLPMFGSKILSFYLLLKLYNWVGEMI